MIAALTGFVATRQGRLILALVAACSLLALASFGAWRTAAVVDGWIADAAMSARTIEQEKWKLQIETSNREVAEARAQRATAIAALEAGAGAEIATLRLRLTELETENARLPDADRCGLGRDRVRLLPP